MAKEPVKIRYKSLVNGDKSIYFDIIQNGHRSYKFLNLRILAGDSKEIIEQNAETMRYVEIKKRQLVKELTLDKARMLERSFATDMTLVEMIDLFVQNKSDGWSPKSIEIYTQLKTYAIEYFKDIPLKEVDDNEISGFIEHLRDKTHIFPRKKKEIKLSDSTIRGYMENLNSVFRFAIGERFIDKNPCDATLRDLSRSSKGISFLSVDEVKRLIDTPCNNPLLKRIFLFVCFSGLRKVEAMNLRWKDIDKSGDYWKMRIETHNVRYTNAFELPINRMARKCLPAQGRAGKKERVFARFNDDNIHVLLQTWAKYAGINKTLSLSVARNTFAIMLLNEGVDEYTVTHLLALTSMRHMLKYTEIANPPKKRAVSLIDDLLDGKPTENMELQGDPETAMIEHKMMLKYRYQKKGR